MSRHINYLPPGAQSTTGIVFLTAQAREVFEIAKALQSTLGRNTLVKLYRKQSWVNMDEITHTEIGES